MRYEIFGKKIVSTTMSGEELTIGFDDGVFVTIKAEASVYLKSDGALRVSPRLNVSTDKIELKAEEES